MSENFFKVIRAGINTTFQDLGRNNLNHIGIPISGVMDRRNYIISNKILQNVPNHPIIEFAYQGPRLVYHGEPLNISVSGDVKFKIFKNKNEIEGKCYETITLEDQDEIDLISTNRSVYGYLAIGADLKIDYQWKSCSINTKANIGSNNGKKLQDLSLIHI